MAHQAREIRVFISSTFRDMQAEREELVKRIFPRLRKMCEQRGVTWGEVDLRWGITEDQTEKGDVLPICLEEIRRCRPYFIGILGERYGWIPDEYPQELLDQQPWLKEHLEHSITELEILHGVLNDPEMTDHAYFYFRDNGYLQKFPPEMHSDFLELPTQKEINDYGGEIAEQRVKKRREKLAILKKRIRDSSFPLHENYPNPIALGELVLHDFTDLINRLYPEGEQQDKLDREAADHEAFVISRAGVYIGRQDDYDRLDAHVQGDGPPLVILGESGVGKSALLANWALRYKKDHPDETLLMHFIGASPYSADWINLLRRLMGELKRNFDLSGEIPDQPDSLRSAFANWLYMAAAKGEVIIILDGLNQLEDKKGALDLVWLPPEIPDGVRLLVSTLPGRPLTALKERGWPMLQVSLLTTTERVRLIDEYLARYSKTLGPDRVGKIAATPQSANPLYLRTLLEEIRVFGVHEELDQRIDYYLDASSIKELYGKVLNRYEEDYEREHQGLVGKMMTFLWAARRGLSEAELLDLAGTNEEPLPQAYWSPLYLAAEESLVNRAGLVGFSHDYLRQAVEERYIRAQDLENKSIDDAESRPTDPIKKTGSPLLRRIRSRQNKPNAKIGYAAHKQLADYFTGQELGPRKIDELPWQLERMEAWPRIFDLLSGLSFLKAAWEVDSMEVKAHWAQVEANSELRMIDAYQKVMSEPRENLDWLTPIITLFTESGYLEEAKSLQEFLVEHVRSLDNPERLATCLNDLAAIIFQTRDANMERAMVLLKEQEQIIREQGDRAGLPACLNNQAEILRTQGDLHASMELQVETERLCRELDDKQVLNASLGNQALILRVQGDLKGALELHDEEERICREIGNKTALGICLGNKALIYDDLGDFRKAIALLKQEEQICRELGERVGLVWSLDKQRGLCMSNNYLDLALMAIEEQKPLLRELEDHKWLAASLANQAVILIRKGRRKEALPCAEEAYGTAARHGHAELAGQIKPMLEDLRRW